MPGWLKRTLSLLAGIITAFAVTLAIELLNQVLYTMPPDFDPHNAESVQRMIDIMPLGAACVVLSAWFFGSLCGAFVAVRLGPGRRMWPAMVIGVLQLLGGVMMVTMYRHPLWFSIVGLVEFLPAALLGGRLAQNTAAPG